ncbi:hypothetical protein [Paenibacillus sp. MER 99-2]|uniref:hypothetical protein n=1 Tax=Paenibacillus sp. MER 99-2 TaxID=2939572 RepID=UPI0020405548|nr:hypothetical protein [Paenibacillus sp. MER 99-2]MCM3170768.1 hypothetical protein [Paenibacillus sp. MER 99-2]
MTSTNSEDLASQYAQFVQIEDEYVDQLVTCNKLILDAMDIIAKRAKVLHMDTGGISPSQHGTGSKPKVI